MHVDGKTSMPRICNPACFSMCGLFQKCLDFRNPKGRHLGKVFILGGHTSTWWQPPLKTCIYFESLCFLRAAILRLRVFVPKGFHMGNLFVWNASKFGWYWQVSSSWFMNIKKKESHFMRWRPFNLSTGAAPLPLEIQGVENHCLKPCLLQGFHSNEQVSLGVQERHHCKTGGSRRTSLEDYAWWLLFGTSGKIASNQAWLMMTQLSSRASEPADFRTISGSPTRIMPPPKNPILFNYLKYNYGSWNPSSTRI